MAWNNKKQGGKPAQRDRQPPPFWATCPKCKEKIACPQDWVLKYLDRVGYDIVPKEEE